MHQKNDRISFYGLQSEKATQASTSKTTHFLQQSTSFAFRAVPRGQKSRERSPSPDYFPNGDIIASKYIVDRFLRGGSFGFVFKCHTENEDKKKCFYAVKISFEFALSKSDKDTDAAFGKTHMKFLKAFKEILEDNQVSFLVC